ncbi:helix-turn-helix transcriptional regulator [Caldibacillus lycopersici]|uniref:Helix-turn-helix transcriptional regulator n=1 Tax=Perspicuibacillus lycopersici TaxID=1325689 RepID=A0AAE3ISK5_9BACI|nr:helix-turn-helix transcriptional regulator [Perspicuibacillus lycopersici]MCU9612651.1 helix-turn-helix transcriptional regulator [Perspicuibacillus lycopersici]
MDVNRTLLSSRIHILRAEHKMTQKQLADKAGVSRQTIISIEKGNYVPSLALAYTISKIFGKTIEEVFIFED